MHEKTKLFIRYFEDCDLRANWNEAHVKLRFSVHEIIPILNDQDEYTKNRNYWKYLKAKLKKERSKVVYGTTQLKLLLREGKQYWSDVLDSNSVLLSQYIQ